MGWWLLLKALLTVLAKKREDLGITIDVEVLLRASIGAATYTTDAYFATLAQVNRRRQRVICRKPRNCVIAASSNCDSASRAPSGSYCATPGTRILARSPTTWQRRRRKRSNGRS